MLKPKKKLTRKQIKEDKLVTYSYKALDFYNQNSRIIILSLLGAVAVVIIGYMVLKSKSEANVAASGRLIRAIESYNNQNYDEAIPVLLKITEQFEGTENAGRACYYLASAYYNKENFTEANKYFQIYLDDYGDNKMFSSTAMAGIAAYYTQQGDHEKAATYYKKAAEKNPQSFTAADYLFSAAESYITLNQNAVARQLLQKIVDDYGTTPKANDAKILLTEIS